MLYHLSEENHNGEIFKPRVPYSIAFDDEDRTHFRICFSPTIAGAFRAIEDRPNNYLELYVHVPWKNGTVKYYKPTKKEVYDVDATHEVWVKHQVKMRCIGKIRAYYKTPTVQFPLPPVRIKWLEKF